MNLEISLEDLLKNGSHFGHNKKRWNPKMEKYIYGEKNGTHILDLRKSLPLIENALKFALECSKNIFRNFLVNIWQLVRRHQMFFYF